MHLAALGRGQGRHLRIVAALSKTCARLDRAHAPPAAVHCCVRNTSGVRNEGDTSVPSCSSRRLRAPSGRNTVRLTKE